MVTKKWVKQKIRHLIQRNLAPVQSQLSRFFKEIEGIYFDLQLVYERLEALENPEVDESGDELPVPWPEIVNLERIWPEDFEVNRVIERAYFDDHPGWDYSDEPTSWAGSLDPVEGSIEGNVWIIGYIPGSGWVMSTFEWLRPYQTYKPGVTLENLADHTKQPLFKNWNPEGYEFYFFTSTRVRNGDIDPARMRSTVKKVELT